MPVSHASDEQPHGDVGQSRQRRDGLGEQVELPPGVWPHSGGHAWRPAAIMIGTIAVAMAVVAGLWTYTRHESGYRIIAVVTVRPGDARTLAACAATAADHGISDARTDADGGFLELVLETQDRAAGIAGMNEAGQAIVTAAQSREQVEVTSQAVPLEQREPLLRRLEQLDGRLATLRAYPSGAAGDEARALLDRWAAAEQQRREADVALAGLDQRAASTLPAESQLVLDTGRMAVAERADGILQAELAVLAQQETQFTETFRGVIENGGPHFDALIGAVAEGSAHVTNALKADYDEGVKKPLRTIEKALGEWAGAASTLAKIWGQQRQRLAGMSGGDLLVSQAEIEHAARAFVDQVAAATVAYDKAVESLGQVEGQATKALVLQSTLTRELRPAVEARQGAETMARSVMLTDNRELAGMVQRLGGLRRRVQERRANTEAAARQKMLADLRAEHERGIKGQREQLEQRARQLDETLDECTVDARKLLLDGVQRQLLLTELIAHEQQRAEVYKALAAVEKDAAQQRAVPEGPAAEVHYVPARVEPVYSTRDRLGHSLTAGLFSFVVCSAVGGVLCAVRSWRSTRETIEAYTRELRTMKGRR